MNKKLVGAKIKSTIGAFEITMQMPTGKPLLLKWKDDKTPVRVPTVVKYRDDFGKEKIFNENFVKHLLTAGLQIQEGKVVGGSRVYPFLELVEEIYEDEIPEGLGIPASIASALHNVADKIAPKKTEKKDEKAV